MLKQLYPTLMRVNTGEKVDALMLQSPEQLARLETKARSRLRQKLQKKLRKTLVRHTVIDSEMHRVRQEFGLIPKENNETDTRAEKKRVGSAVTEISRSRTAHSRRSRRRASDPFLTPRYTPRDFAIGTRGLSKYSKSV